HEICGRPMLAYVLDACRAAGVRQCCVVVGHGKDAVMSACADDHDIRWVEQTEQKGTGHAVQCCRAAVDGQFDHTLVLCGDGPLLRSQTLGELLDRHEAEGAAATLATAEIEDPTGYGRIWRDEAGMLRGIVEHGDCTPEQRRIREVNPSYYCFRVPELFSALEQVRPNNAKNEYYVTDVLGILIEAGHKVQGVTAVLPEDIFSINSRHDLAHVNAVMRDRITAHWMASGVTIVDPANTWIDARATIGVDTVIHPFVMIRGAARIGRACSLGPFASLSGDMQVGDNTSVGSFCGGAR
ncbi:MAG: NTP transferase domain-containing protein, partial [Planctomycetes bacterium]|nr:NTP transferase domain-containing protein [Planctomycetota bacterium]